MCFPTGPKRKVDSLGSSLQNRFSYSDEAKTALEKGEPVVALESTVITHGLPQPENLNLATRLEQIVRKAGATPATIAVFEGKVHIGLQGEELRLLAESESPLKLSGRDLAKALIQQRNGGTTVAATLRLAEAAGIHVFATGGIGGVHRGSNWDVSADLTELGQRQVVCVCAGAKAILDLPATLEHLETLSVPVLGYQTEHFPAFYTRSSGLELSLRVDEVEQVNRFVRNHWALGGQGVLLTVPIPEESEIPRQQAERWVKEAERELETAGIRGGASTPFLLKRLGELSRGQTLKSNLALLENNARMAAQLAQQDWGDR